MRANFAGGFLGWNLFGTAIYVSRSDTHKTVIHEFGHFGLDVLDEYEDGTSKQCTAHPPGPFGHYMPQASCIMWLEGRTNKICSIRRENPHVMGLREGDQACWDKIVSRYNKPAWKLLTPVDRGGIPGTIQWATGPITMIGLVGTTTSIDNIDAANLLGDCALTIVDAVGLAVSRATVKTRDASGRWLAQGTSDKFGKISIVGVHVGDRLRIETSTGFAHEEDVPAGAMTLTIVLTE